MSKRREQSEDEGSEEEDRKKQPKHPKFESRNLPKMTNPNRIVINISDCQYPVVRLVAKLLKWKVQTDPEATDWDMWWTDNAVLPETLFRMQHHQKINHFPGMYILARKNLLGKGLMKMKKQFPQDYNFFPLTWMLPSEYSEFRLYFESKPKGKSRTYIVKPEALSQGKGIFLTRRLQDIAPGEHYVVQRYLHKPYLIEGLKFDFRIYVLLAGVDPLRVYLFNEGLARFATEPYVIPTRENMEDVCMHLTNYAINKDSPNFVFNESEKDMSIGHKRSLTSVFELLGKQGLDVGLLKQQIKDILIKTFISGLPLIRHQYRSCQLDNYAGNMCFEVLGFDVILTSKGEPNLLEVNHTPSFTTDTPLDELIKKNLIRDSLVLMNINTTSKAEITAAKRQELNNRVYAGKKAKFTPEERETLRAEAQKERDSYENQHLGGFEKIYPVADEAAMRQYSLYLQHSERLYEESTGIKRKPKDKEPAKEKVDKIVEKAQAGNVAKRSSSITRTAKPPVPERLIHKPISEDETKLVKEDSGFLPCIRTGDSPNHRSNTPSSSQNTLKADSITQDEAARSNAESFDLQGQNKYSREMSETREQYEHLTKNYADYMQLKESFKKKSMEERGAEPSLAMPDPPRNYINQINFSFFINEVRVEPSSDRKKLDPKRRKEHSQLNCKNRNLPKGVSIDRPPKHPLSLNTLLQPGEQTGAVSIGNLKQLLNRKRQGD